jgi:arylsulfatase A-like enzyme
MHWSRDLAVPPRAPNVLIVLYDDTGQAAWSPFGGGIDMPTLQKLADRRLTYSQWHTTALCSPTRSTFLTGRNHHLNGCSCITEGAQGFPGWSGRLPAECATIGQVLQDSGWSTFWFGKNHNVPDNLTSAAGPFDNWPTGQGFDLFYGFIAGETDQFFPSLIRNTEPIEPPRRPEEGYQLTRDLADQCISWIHTQKAIAPDRPFCAYFSTGAAHAPHQPPLDWRGRNKGRFDMGWDKYRDRPRQPAEGWRHPEGKQVDATAGADSVMGQPTAGPSEAVRTPGRELRGLPGTL